MSLLFDYERLTKYGTKGYATLLDSYMQGTKTKTKPTNKKSISYTKKKGEKERKQIEKTIFEYEYKRSYKEKELLDKLYLNETKRNETQKRKDLAQAFKDINLIGGLPKYIYNKIERTWYREDYNIFLKEVIK